MREKKGRIKKGGGREKERETRPRRKNASARLSVRRMATKLNRSLFRPHIRSLARGRERERAWRWIVGSWCILGHARGSFYRENATGFFPRFARRRVLSSPMDFSLCEWFCTRERLDFMCIKIINYSK